MLNGESQALIEEFTMPPGMGNGVFMEGGDSGSSTGRFINETLLSPGPTPASALFRGVLDEAHVSPMADLIARDLDYQTRLARARERAQSGVEGRRGARHDKTLDLTELSAGHSLALVTLSLTASVGGTARNQATESFGAQTRRLNPFRGLGVMDRLRGRGRGNDAQEFAA